MNTSTDFYFDGKYLSGFGLVICSIDGSSDGTFSTGSVGDVNNFRPTHSYKWNYLGYSYSEPLSFEFQVAKIGTNAVCETINQDEIRSILKWLKQRTPYKEFCFIPSNPVDDAIYYEAIIESVDEIRIGGSVIGFELRVLTNSPFGFSKEKTVTIAANGEKTIAVDSDEREYIYPHIEITAAGAGDVSIDNVSNGSGSAVNNLSVGEIVTIDKTSIGVMSSLSTHNAIQDFNKKWFKLSDGKNELKVTGNATVLIKYREPRKAGG